MFNRNVLFLGDSIALAVQNVKYSIPVIQFERAQTLLNIVKNTIAYEPSNRSGLTEIIDDLKEMSNFDGSGNGNGVVNEIV